jgi:hypothetical protein
MDAQKMCTKCHIEKGPSGFYESQKGKGSVCKECIKQQMRMNRKRAIEVERDTSEADLSASPSEPSEKSTSLYILVNPLIPGMVKIGRASCPLSRAQSMSQSHPFSLTVFQSYHQMGFLESTVHRRLAERRVASGPGREWFHATPDEADLIIRATVLEHKFSQEGQSQA